MPPQLQVFLIILLTPFLNFILGFFINKISERYPLSIRDDILWWISIFICFLLAYITLPQDVHKTILIYIGSALVLCSIIYYIYVLIISREFKIEDGCEIAIVGPQASGKTFFILGLIESYFTTLNNPIVSIEPIGFIAENMKKMLLIAPKAPPTRLYANNSYSISVIVKPNFFQNPRKWLGGSNISFSITLRDSAGEIFENPLRLMEYNSEKYKSFLLECGHTSGLIILIDALDLEKKLDRGYSDSINYLKEELLKTLKRGGRNPKKYKIAIILAKFEQVKNHKFYQDKSQKYVEDYFPRTYKTLQKWHQNWQCKMSYFACSAFGFKGQPPEPNANPSDGTGSNAIIADFDEWTPFGLIAPIYWLATGRNDKRFP